MSLQAAAVTQIMRLFGSMMLGTSDPLDMREKFHRAAERIPPAPPDAAFEETLIAGKIKAYWVSLPDADRNKVLMYLHGGAYMFGGTVLTHRDLIWRLAKVAQCPVLSVDYRLAPEEPFPAAWDDANTAYRWLLERFSSQSIALAGDSAGGGLAFASMLRARDEGLAMPSAVVGLSPWTDLACTGESVVTNADRDVMIPGQRIKEAAGFVLGDLDPTHPYASPLYGDYTDCSPALIQVGSSEVLLDDARRLAYKMESSGVPVVLDVWSKMPHVWQAMASILPEGKVAIDRIGVFLRGHMRSIPRHG